MRLLKAELKPRAFTATAVTEAGTRLANRHGSDGGSGCGGDLRDGDAAIDDGVVVAENLKVESLRRFKDDATEVKEGFECGIGLGSFNDIKVDDVIETFEMKEIART